MARKLAFMEARLTLLERQFAAHFQGDTARSAARPAGDLIRIACDEPGLFISRTYANELDEWNRKFCWIGNDGPIQIVLPVAPHQPLRCSLKLVPHPRVDMHQVRVLANDTVANCVVGHGSDVSELNFDVATSTASKINLVLTNLDSVRPSDHGENDDTRLLAARFFGAELTVL